MAANDVPCCKPMFWVYLLTCTGLVLFAGLMSGLTLGLMSLSLVDLEVLMKAGKPQDRKHAAKILPVVKNQHLLLCTLLVCNSLAMEALPIFLDALLPAWGAILMSVTLILAFGEIIPQAVCSRYGLKIGAKLASVVRVLLLIFLPITYPISKLLDWLLGKGHFVLLRRAELKTLVDMHGNEAGKGGELTHDETTIISGALDLTQKTAKDAMTPIAETFSLDINSKLDMQTMGMIMTRGHSRVPIYSGNPTNVVGLILVKNLITCRPEDEVPIRSVTIRKIPRVREYLPLYSLLNEFQKGHSHMAVVVKCSKDTMEPTENINGRTRMLESRVGINKKRRDIEGKAIHDGSRSTQLEQITVCSGYPSTTGMRSPASKVGTERHGETAVQPRKWERAGENDILDVNSESLPSFPEDEEVIGIITMEDVMEELLQEEILDETDEYVDVHNKITINMLPPRKSSPKSPKAAQFPSLPRRTPGASPLSSYNQSPPSQSPTSSYVRVPGQRPTQTFSPDKSVTSSPVNNAVQGRLSPSSIQVSR
ncbi:DUF21 domain-containing protein At2g14520-like isoform X1 [Nymphaea colorata]|nr:DUF21 domain-containing protein At2g14520-like isoform X1 [Nymphaea colorata]